MVIIFDKKTFMRTGTEFKFKAFWAPHKIQKNEFDFGESVHFHWPKAQIFLILKLRYVVCLVFSIADAFKRCLSNFIPLIQRFTIEKMFEAKILQGALLKKIIEAIRELVVDANLDCNDRGITMQVRVGLDFVLINFFSLIFS